MIIINQAVLHILDFNSGITVFSDRTLPLENSVEAFLLKHIEKSYQDQSLKTGDFYEDSVFKQRINDYCKRENVSFIEFSRWLAEKMYEAVAKSDNLVSADLLVADIKIDDRRMIAIFKCNNKIGFIHQVTQSDAGICNEIINHYAILPNLSQKIDECAFIDVTDGSIKFSDKKYICEGDAVFLLPEVILECAYTTSPKVALSEMTTIAKKVAEKHGQNTVEAVTAAKSFIAEKVQQFESVEPAELSKEIFKDSPLLQEEYLVEAQNAGLADTVKLEADYAIKKTKMHKLKTDTGIELNIPLDYFQNTEYVEFINNSNGTVSINLKNISNIINK